MYRRVLLLTSVGLLVAVAGCHHHCHKKPCDTCGPGPSGSRSPIVLPPQAGHDSCIVDYSARQSQIAVLRDAFHVWDGWVIGAIVLWAIATAAIARSVREYRKPADKARELVVSGQTGPNAELTALNRTSTGLLLRALASAAIVLIVIDMIWKPGA